MPNILLIGDIMLDINHIAECNRLANEAPIPIYNILETKYILGGAGNVANHLKSLNLDFIFLTLIGNDEYGLKVKDLLNEKNITNHLLIDNRPTTIKNRIFVNNKLVSRFDNESINGYNHLFVQDYIKTNNFDYIIISDYQKGLLTKDLYLYLIQYSQQNNIKILCDPKDNNLDKYKNIYLLKPNKKEFELLIRKKCNTIDEIIKEGIEFKKNMNISKLYITLAELGILYINHNNIPFYTPTKKTDVIDVTGAGDTILSLLLYIELNNIDENQIGHLCNYIGLKSVQTVGNYNINLTDINNFYLDNKILTINNLKILIQKLKKDNKKIVFTNGCFDIIHRGHVEYLKKSKELGDILILGLNSDSSIKQNKGDSRPYNKLEDRIYILEQFPFIDYIIVFDEKTPIDLINIINPNIYTKGAEYTKDNICNVLGENIRNKIVLIDYLNNYSSSKYINLLNH
jgi:D-beta-D-heptose 7-phosphate kinase/D-beta-D-heptose 1-phosphate adenosyltransferase